MNIMKTTNWTEKYRPTTLTEMIMPDSLKKMILGIAHGKAGMSLLFHGKSGTGKSTVARLINPDCNYYFECLSSKNSAASLKQLERTCSAAPLFGYRRTIIIDEGDSLTTEGQRTLCRLVETMAASNDLIVTTNYSENLIPALISRLKPISFDFLETAEYKESIEKRLKYIASSEGHLNIDEALFKSIIVGGKMDIRAMINRLQYELSS